MKINTFTKIIDELFPINVAVEGDKVGLQLDAGVDEVKTVLVSFELNDNVVEEAMKIKADLIISFHPLIFRSLGEILTNERVGRICTKLIKSSIAFYSIHTSFDVDPLGTNVILAKKLKLKNLKPLGKDTGNTIGIVGELERSTNRLEFIRNCSEIFASTIKSNSQGPEIIKNVAIIGGSGISYLHLVESDHEGIDAFITADVKYHDFHRVNGKLNLIDPGHYEMEQFNAEAIYKRLKRELEGVITFQLSKVCTNPVEYYPNAEFKNKQINNFN